MSEERRAGRELDRACAEARGDRPIKRGQWKGYWDCGNGQHYSDEDGGPLHYSTDRASALLLEDEIERRWLSIEYGEALIGLLDLYSDYPMGGHDRGCSFVLPLSSAHGRS